MNALFKRVLMPLAFPFRLRFTAGTNSQKAVIAAKRMRASGLIPMLNYLGEHFHDPLRAHEHLLEYLDVLPCLSAGDRIVVKASQLGLDIPDCGLWHARENLRYLLTKTKALGIAVELDMENSVRAEPAIQLALWANAEFPMQTRMALAARMFKSIEYAHVLCMNGVPVRLVKGAYEDTSQYAIKKPDDIKNRYKHLTILLLKLGIDPAFATHDKDLLNFVIQEARRYTLRATHYEFQFLKGFCPRMQRAMVRQGFRVAVYLPYGPTWFDYGIRRWKFFRRNPKDLLRAIFG